MLTTARKQSACSIAFRISVDSKSPPESRSESAQVGTPSASSAFRNSRTTASSFEEWEMKTDFADIRARSFSHTVGQDGILQAVGNRLFDAFPQPTSCPQNSIL